MFCIKPPINNIDTEANKFEAVNDDDLDNVHRINGMMINVEHESKCDYCNRKIDIKNVQYNYYCYDCMKEVCYVCRYNCLRHDIRSGIGRVQKQCDVCDSQILIMQPHYSSGPLIKSDVVSVNMCMECDTSLESPIIQKIKNIKYKLSFIYEDLNFGSLYDWFYIAKSDDGCAILVNMNTKSRMYKRFAFRRKHEEYDDEYIYFTSTKDRVLESVLKEYNCVGIKAMMEKRNML